MLMIDLLLLTLAMVLSIPVLWFFVQVMLGGKSESDPSPGGPSVNLSTDSPSVAVLIPAHNESTNLLPTLYSIANQGYARTRVLVVADNCTDDTAAVAHAAGVEVIQRFSTTERGKGYALDFGIAHLMGQNPPEVLIVLDADCLLDGTVLEPLARQAHALQRPVQALYLMQNIRQTGLKGKIAEFAWIVKNWCRPKGLHRLGLGCQLTGSGMAFPWSLVARGQWATGHIVEDMKLGLAFAAQGDPALFSEHTIVTSFFPENTDGQNTQRTRWEHGHLSMLLQDGLPAVFNGLRRGNWPFLALGLDICIPPLALLVLMVSGMALISTGWAFSSGSLWSAWAAWLTIIEVLALGVAVGLAWHQHGRHVISGSELLCAPLYALQKIPMYLRYVFKRQVSWVRSKRD